MTETLVAENTDSSNRTYYKSIVVRIQGVSQYNSNQYSFEGLSGYWEWSGANPLVKGQSYEVELTSRPKTGDRAKPGSLYQDIRSAVATDSAPSVQAPQSGSEGAGRGYLGEPEMPHWEQQAWDDEETAKHQEPPPVPAALGACQNHAMVFIESGIIPIPEGRDPLNFLWELRDRIYRNVNRSGYHPEPFCYVHQQPYKLSPKSEKWGHVLEDGSACVEGQS